MSSATDFLSAVQAGDLARVRQLLAAEPSLVTARDPQGRSALLLARYNNRSDVFEALLAARPALDIFEAAVAGKTNRVRELIAADKSLARAVMPDGATALHLAGFFRHGEIVELLLAAGAAVDAVAPGFGNVQPLHSAVAGRDLRCVEAILKAAADPNAKQAQGWTALHSFASHGNMEGSRLLLAHGADPDQKADNGQSSIDMAQEKGFADLVTLLRTKTSAVGG